MNIAAIDALTVGTFLIMTLVIPLLGVWDFRWLRRRLAAGHDKVRIRFYAWLIALEWSLAVGLGAWWFATGRGATELRLAPVAEGWQWLAIGLGLAVAVTALLQMCKVLGNAAELAKVRDQIGRLRGMVPTNPVEARGFDLVSLSAGICEEFLYRGVLMVTLTGVFGLWPAVGLSSVVFGFGHVYQGPAGVAKTALVGLLLALLTVFSGSLFIAMLLHAVLDLTSGRMMAAALRPAAPAPDSPLSAQ